MAVLNKNTYRKYDFKKVNWNNFAKGFRQYNIMTIITPIPKNYDFYTKLVIELN